MQDLPNPERPLLFQNDIDANMMHEAQEVLKKFPSDLHRMDLSSIHLMDYVSWEPIFVQSIPATVSILNVSFNQMGRISAKNLRTMLLYLPLSLRSLDLTGNNFSEAQLEVIYKYCKNNENLTDLHLEGFHDDQRQAIVNKIKCVLDNRRHYLTTFFGHVMAVQNKEKDPPPMSLLPKHVLAYIHSFVMSHQSVETVATNIEKCRKNVNVIDLFKTLSKIMEDAKKYLDKKNIAIFNTLQATLDTNNKGYSQKIKDFYEVFQKNDNQKNIELLSQATARSTPYCIIGVLAIIGIIASGIVPGLAVMFGVHAVRKYKYGLQDTLPHHLFKPKNAGKALVDQIEKTIESTLYKSVM